MQFLVLFETVRLWTIHVHLVPVCTSVKFCHTSTSFDRIWLTQKIKKEKKPRWRSAPQSPRSQPKINISRWNSPIIPNYIILTIVRNYSFRFKREHAFRCSAVGESSLWWIVVKALVLLFFSKILNWPLFPSPFFVFPHYKQVLLPIGVRFEHRFSHFQGNTRRESIAGNSSVTVADCYVLPSLCVHAQKNHFRSNNQRNSSEFKFYFQIESNSSIISFRIIHFQANSTRESIDIISSATVADC